MAENLGTLEYLLKINSEQAEKDLKDIEKLVKDQSNRVEQVFKKYGQTISDQGFDSIKKKLASLKTEYEKLSVAGKGDTSAAKRKLAEIQQLESAVRVLNDAYKAQEKAIKDVEAAAKKLAKEQQSAKFSLETQRSKAFVASEIAKEREITREIKNQESAKRSLEAQRSKAFVKGELEKERELARIIKEQEAAIKSLNAQRSRALIAIEKEQQASKRSLEAQRSRAYTKKQEQIDTKALAEQKLRAAIAATEAGSIARLRAEYALMTFQLKNITKDTPNATAEIKRLTAAMAQHRETIAQLQPTEGLWGKLKRAIVTYATAYLSVQGAIASARAFFKQTKELDQLSFAMSTVIKDSAELAQTQKFLSDVAVNYGGDLLTLSERYIKFRAAAMQSNMTASETQKIFDTVSKAAGTLGLKTDELSGVYLALEQMISKGKVTTEELRRQLGERLPGAFGIMANALGVTLPQLDKMLKKGEVLSKDALPKFAAALEKAYGIESLKKIDTLAAAQGRLSTETTGLIKAFEASDEFKNFFNTLASIVKTFRENIGVIIAFAKAIGVITTAVVTYRLALALQLAIQKQMVYWTGRQIASLAQLSEAQVTATVTARAAAGATTAWSNAFKTFGGWIGIVLSLVASLVVSFGLFRKDTKATADAMGELNKQQSKQIDILKRSQAILNDSTTGTNQYKNALQDVNVIAAKYNQELLTEQSTRKEINKTIKDSIDLVKQEYAEKRKAVLLDREEAARAAAIDPLLERMTTYFEEQGALDPTGRAIDQLKAFQDYVAKGFSAERISKLIIGGTLSDINLMLNKAIEAEKRYVKETAEIRRLYPDKPKSEVFDIEELNLNIEAAKDEFEKARKLATVGGKLALPVLSKDFATEEAYLKSLLVQYAKFPEAIEIINLRIAELDKATQKRGGKTAAEIQGEKLEAQIAIVNQLKKAYDDLRKIFGEGAAAKELENIFGADVATLGIDVDFNLTDEKYQKWGEEMKAKADKIGGDVGAKIGESLAKSLNKTTVEGTIDKGKAILDRFDRELEDFERKQAQRESIFAATGEEELALKLSFNTDAIVDAEQFVKNRILQLANELGQQDLFEGTYESMIANIDKFTPELKKKIEAVQKYLKDRQENMLLDAVQFIFKNVPEGQDIEFDFSKVVTGFENAIREIKTNIGRITAEPQLMEKLGLSEKEIERLKNLQINAANEIAKNAAEKLGADYIKNNLPEKLRADFENMEHASTESIRLIIEAIKKMQNEFIGAESLGKIFKSFELDGLTNLMSSLSETNNIDSFIIKLDEILSQIELVDRTAESSNISGDLVKTEDIDKLNILILTLKRFGFNFKTAIQGANTKAIEKFAKDAKKLANEIDGLIEGVKGLSDALGIELTDSAEQALDSIKTASIGIVGIIEGAALAADATIKGVEKASVILGIISAAMSVVQGIGKFFSSFKPEDKQTKAIEETNRLLERQQSLLSVIAGTSENYYNLAIKQIADYNTSIDQNTEKLQQSHILTKKDREDAAVSFNKYKQEYKDALNFMSSAELRKTNPKLYAYGQMSFDQFLQGWNGESTKWTADEFANQFAAGLITLDEEELAALDGIFEKRKRIIELQDDIYRNIVGFGSEDIANEIMQGIEDGLKLGADNSLGDFSNLFGNTLKKALMKGVTEAITLTLSTGFMDKLTKALLPTSPGGVEITPEEGAAIQKDYYDAVKESTEKQNAVNKFLEDYGIDLGTVTEEGIRSEIQAIQEPTARRLEGLINTIRETGVNNNTVLNRLAQSNEMIQGYAGQSLTHLVNIDTNTKAQLDLLTSLVVKGNQGAALKVQVN